MKIRQGFVSNSSSTSFAIYGVATNEDELFKKLFGGKIQSTTKENGCEHIFNREKNKFCSKCGSQNYIVEENEYCYDDLEEELEKLGLEMVTDMSIDNFDENDLDEDVEHVVDIDTIVGYNLKGKGGKRQLLKTPKLIKEVEGKLKKLFPHNKPNFYVGQMSC